MQREDSTTMMPKLLLLATLFGSLFTTFDIAYAGMITGEVKFVDNLPKVSPTKVTKDQDYCGETIPNESYLIEANGGLKNVVVFIESAPTGRPADPQKENFLYNDGCRYAPHVLAIQKGERLRVKSHDPKLHIPHGYLGERTVFNLSLPFKNTTLDATSKIRQSGIMKVVCDTHAWMLGFVHVFEHPFFAVTNEQGLFSIPDLPPGSYVLKAWHEDGGIKTQEVLVPESGDVRVSFEFGKK
jgi:hypothetical protein